MTEQGADGSDTDNPGEKPGEDTYVYQVVDVQPADWSGDYLLMDRADNEFHIFDSYDGQKSGKSTCTLTLDDFVADGIPARTGDPMKSVIAKVGDYYSIYVSNVGYIGLDKDEKFLRVHSDRPEVSDKGYLWKIALWDSQKGLCNISNAGFTSKKLQWNDSAKMFRCYNSGQKDLALYRRNVSDGEIGGEDPDNPGGGDVENPDPDPDPEEPDPDPTPVPGGMKGWYELPAIYDEDGNGIHDTDKTLYYASHLCAGNETYSHNGKKGQELHGVLQRRAPLPCLGGSHKAYRTVPGKHQENQCLWQRPEDSR